jgi:hypothetical protein
VVVMPSAEAGSEAVATALLLGPAFAVAPRAAPAAPSHAGACAASRLLSIARGCTAPL